MIYGRFEGGCDRVEFQPLNNVRDAKPHLEVIVDVRIYTFGDSHSQLERRHGKVDELVKVTAELYLVSLVWCGSRSCLEPSFNLDVKPSISFGKVVMVPYGCRTIWSNAIKVSDLDLSNGSSYQRGCSSVVRSFADDARAGGVALTSTLPTNSGVSMIFGWLESFTSAHKGLFSLLVFLEVSLVQNHELFLY